MQQLINNSRVFESDEEQEYNHNQGVDGDSVEQEEEDDDDDDDDEDMDRGRVAQFEEEVINHVCRTSTHSLDIDISKYINSSSSSRRIMHVLVC